LKVEEEEEEEEEVLRRAMMLDAKGKKREAKMRWDRQRKKNHKRQ